MNENPPLFSADSLYKRFNALNALDNISLSIQAGEIIGLAGRSGAGKSVLMQILAGLCSPDSGQLQWCGQPLPMPFRGLDYQIGYITSEPALVEEADITANIFLGREITAPFLGQFLRIPRQKQMVEKAAELLHQLDWPFANLNHAIANLTSEQRQLVSIARTMATPQRLILVDDPTQLLGLPRQKKLLQLMEKWQSEGVAILFSSNELDHLFAITDKILVLNEGRMAGLFHTDETSREEVVLALAGWGNQREFSTTLWALDRYYQVRQEAETLQHQQQLLQRDLATQNTLNRQLLAQLSEQVLALDTVNVTLQGAQRRLLTEREEERKHLAREIHDQVLQDLLSVNYELEEMGDNVEATGKVEAREIIEIRQQIREMVEELRRICGALRPPSIDSLGLGAAVRSFAGEWERRTGVEVKLEIADHFGRLPEHLELSIFRIIQESLNNISKHAQATQVHISLYPTSPRLLLISIADNGQGLPPHLDLTTLGKEGHYGLLGISERVALLGGRLRCENQPNSGLLLQIELPHPRVVTSS